MLYFRPGDKKEKKIHIVVLCVRSTALHAIHLQFDINAYALEIRPVQIPKYIN
jgi:hypothetical protein